MQITNCFVVTIAFGLLLWILPLTSTAGTFRDDFDDGDLEGWKPNIATGLSVVNGELQFKSADPLILKIGDPSWKGYSLEAQVKIAEFAGGGWFSIRILQDNSGELSGYYELRFGQGAIIAALHVNNRCMESFRVDETVEEKIWHRVKMTPSNGKVLFYLDEVLIAQLTDLGLSGYADMCSTKGTHVYVDDVVISGPNIPDTGPSGPKSFSVTPCSKLTTTWGRIRRMKALQR